MRLALLLLLFFVICIFAERIGEEQSRKGKQFLGYRNDYNDYPGEVQPDYNYGYQAADPRLFLRQTSTNTTTSTSTSTFTCTRSVANACAGGRKRRGILLDEDSDEQFLVSPTVVQGSEASQDPIRESRSASPQILMYPPELAQYHPQSGLDQYYNYVPLNYYYEPFSVARPAANNRLFLGLALNLVNALATTKTVTSTTVTVTTSTSIPACSAAGSFPQCPNAG